MHFLLPKATADFFTRNFWVPEGWFANIPAAFLPSHIIPNTTTRGWVEEDPPSSAVIPSMSLACSQLEEHQLSTTVALYPLLWVFHEK